MERLGYVSGRQERQRHQLPNILVDGLVGSVGGGEPNSYFPPHRLQGFFLEKGEDAGRWVKGEKKSANERY
ncbi:hypothetical protein DPMN_167520 [Dreissena polymorpha]|uniref:Uncharacterized protein n=1 Tax=Dreissena polymorpha TaxID=45954 RepID=A0A9D4F412_DREPO|nr:hypothetical protein DPMN_167520 [Dreissena polymorpha]